MSTFSLQIITPEKIFFEGEVQRVIVRTTEGDVGILAKHEKYVAALPSGPVKITMPDGTERLAALSGGAVKVSPSMTAILANERKYAVIGIIGINPEKAVGLHIRMIPHRMRPIEGV